MSEVIELLVAIGMVHNWRQRGPWALFVAGLLTGNVVTTLLDTYMALLLPALGGLLGAYQTMGFVWFAAITGMIALAMIWILDR